VLHRKTAFYDMGSTSGSPIINIRPLLFFVTFLLLKNKFYQLMENNIANQNAEYAAQL
jgi:hypothetical protein